MNLSINQNSVQRVLRRLLPAACGLGIGIVALLAYWPGAVGTLIGMESCGALKPLKTADRRIGDSLHGLFAAPPPAVPRICVVGVTAETVARFGQMPWSWTKYAELTRTLNQAGASVVALDLPLPHSRAGEPEFARAVRASATRVILPRRSMMPDAHGDHSAPDRLPPILRRDPDAVGPSVDGVFRYPLYDVSDFADDGAIEAGHINILLDDDMVARRVPAAIGEPTAIGEPNTHKFFLPLGVAAALPMRPIAVRFQAGSLWCDSLRIPLDENGCILINFRPFETMVDTRPDDGGSVTTPAGRAPISYYSCLDVLDGNVSPAAFKDAIVLVGQCAWGSHEELRLTPEGSQYESLIQATLLHTVLARAFLEPASSGRTVLAMLALSVLLGALCFRWRYHGSDRLLIGGGLLLMVLGVGLCLCVVGLFRRNGILLDATPFLAVIGLNLAAAVTQNAAHLSAEADIRNREMNLLLAAGKHHMSEMDEPAPTLTAIPGVNQMALSSNASVRSPEIVVETFHQTIPCDGAMLFLIGHGGALTFERTVSHGFSESPGASRNDAEAAAVRFAWQTLRLGRPVILSPRDPDWRCPPGVTSLRSVLGVPVFATREPLAVILLFNKRPNSSSPERSFAANDLRLVAALRYQSAALLENARRCQLEYAMFDGFARSLAKAVDFRDRYTRGHSERVARLSANIASELSLSPEEIEVVRRAATLHDLGKIGVNDVVLRKPGRLSEEEFAQIRAHAANGYEILKAAPSFEPLLPGIRHHHERYDGNGYPDGLAGNAIPLLARIIAAADAYDAMTSNRTYRKGLPTARARQELIRGSGTQFDPLVIEALLHCLDNHADNVKLPTGTHAVTPAARHAMDQTQLPLTPIRPTA